MNVEELTGYCQSFDYSTTEIQWGNVLVFKVEGKMFCFVALDESPLKMNLKCDPEEAVELRERFPAVTPGFHMNKKYWNTITLDETISDSLIRLWIENSYRLVVAKLPKNRREQLSL